MRARTNLLSKRRPVSLIAAALVAVAGCFGASAGRPGAGAIFMYHHVSATVLPGPYARALTVTPAEFANQLAWLQRHGCVAVSVNQILRDARRNSLAPCEVALTFDDGYDDAAAFAAPLLRHFGDTGTFYIATGFVGRPGHLSVAQIRSLHHSGMQIGAHSVHHLDLTALTQADAVREIDASAATLRGWVGTPISTFAYPAGQVSGAVASSVRALRFDNAVTTQPGYVTARSERYELPRYRIERGSGLTLMAAMLGANAAGPGAGSALEHIARERIAGNDPAVAEAIAVALLARKFPEQVLKVHVLALQPATVAGIVLSGVKFHHAVNRRQFSADVEDMVQLGFAAAPSVDEIDVWATVPVALSAGAPVSGDYAVPTAKTVFSAAVIRRRSAGVSGGVDLGTTYWDPLWLP